MLPFVEDFKEQRSVYGKCSVVIYGFILVFGGVTTVMCMVAPLLSADCMASPFRDVSTPREADQLVWFKADGRMCGAIATLFLLGVYMLGHSMRSLLLLCAWGWLNFFNFAVVIPMDFQANKGSEEAESCLENMRMQIGGFAVLEAIGVVCCWLEERSKPLDSDSEPLNP